MSYYIQDARTKVEIQNDLEDVKATIDKLLPGARRLLETEARAVHDAARARWPVRTGESRDGLYWGVAVASDLSFIRGFVSNSVDYAFYVKSAKVNSGTNHAATELIRKPMDARTGYIVATLGPALEAAMEE